MEMRMTTTLSHSLKLNQILRGEKMRTFCDLLEMTNSELLAYLKDGEGKGKEGKYPMFYLDELMSIQHKTDVLVNGGIIYETSNDFIKYSSDNGGQTKNPYGTYGSLAWMLKKREEIIRVASAFVLHYHLGFFWREELLRPVSMAESVNYINDHKDTFSVSRNVDYSLFTRATRNKSLQVGEKEYKMRFFFTSEKHRVELTRDWLVKTIYDNTVNGKSTLTDGRLADKFLESFGFSLARRTITKFRRELGLVNSYGH